MSKDERRNKGMQKATPKPKACPTPETSGPAERPSVQSAAPFEFHAGIVPSAERFANPENRPHTMMPRFRENFEEDELQLPHGSRVYEIGNSWSGPGFQVEMFRAQKGLDIRDEMNQIMLLPSMVKMRQAFRVRILELDPEEESRDLATPNSPSPPHRMESEPFWHIPRDVQRYMFANVQGCSSTQPPEAP